MEKIQKVLTDNPSILYRIQHVLEFYAKGDGYDKDNGFLAKSLLKDIDEINNLYTISDNVFDDKWSFEKEYEQYQINYPHYINPKNYDYDEIIKDIDDINKQYYIPDNVVDDKWSFEIDYPHYINPKNYDYDEIIKQQEELLNLLNKYKNDE